ncbi:MAG: cation:proton antiporter [Elusimicrobiota bacterium]
MKLFFIVLSIFITSPSLLFSAETAGHEDTLISQMALIVFQLSFILFAAWLGGTLFSKMRLPAVLGEIIAGVIIGPYFLGHIHMPGFSDGLFPLIEGQFPVSAALYAFTTIASIILLFLVGIETDIRTFFKFSFAGSILGTGGVIASFACGDYVAVLLSPALFGYKINFSHPVALFLGVISVATSVGITARILSEKRKMDSPEGVTILSAAVVDDVLGIIVLAIIVGIVKSGHIEWKQVTMIGLKAIGIWLGFTIAGLIFSYNLSRLLKKAKDRATISILSFALALFLAGIFEKSGLAMIIGAYIMGLSLSKTDLAFIIQDNLSALERFFVPIFFCVMGMLVDVRSITSLTIVKFGLIYTGFAVLGKIIGCGLPALLLNFNLRGAIRIGVGMIPRGEVALIIMGIGLTAGILTPELFSIAVIMTFLTTLITPPILAKLFESHESGLRKAAGVDKEHREVRYKMPNPETSELILAKVLDAFDSEGFYVHRMEITDKIYQIRKEETFITLRYNEEEFAFNCAVEDESFIHTLFYEVLADMEYLIKHLKNLADTEKVGEKILVSRDESKKDKIDIAEIISPLAVNVNLKSNNKTDIIAELIDLLIKAGQLNHSKRDEVVKDVTEREMTMSTGLQKGIAFPHAKTLAVDNIVVAIGVKKGGIDFDSLDKKPSSIFVITLSPKESPKPYLQFMAELTKVLTYPGNIEKILDCDSNQYLYKLLTARKSKI